MMIRGASSSVHYVLIKPLLQPLDVARKAPGLARALRPQMIPATPSANKQIDHVLSRRP